MQLRIGDNIRLLRNASRYSLEELSEIIGVSRQTIAKWEANETNPDIDNCVKLSTLFKKSQFKSLKTYRTIMVNISLG